jgi:hypothetical protein
MRKSIRQTDEDKRTEQGRDKMEWCYCFHNVKVFFTTLTPQLSRRGGCCS